MNTKKASISFMPKNTEVGLSILRRPTHTIVRLSGDLDIAAAPALRERLATLIRPGMGSLILDLSDVPFCDAAGLAVLIGTQRRAIKFGLRLCLVAPRPQISKILHATGLDRALTIYASAAAAVMWRERQPAVFAV